MWLRHLVFLISLSQLHAKALDRAFEFLDDIDKDAIDIFSRTLTKIAFQSSLNANKDGNLLPPLVESKQNYMSRLFSNEDLSTTTALKTDDNSKETSLIPDVKYPVSMNKDMSPESTCFRKHSPFDGVYCMGDKVPKDVLKEDKVLIDQVPEKKANVMYDENELPSIEKSEMYEPAIAESKESKKHNDKNEAIDLKVPPNKDKIEEDEIYSEKSNEDMDYSHLNKFGGNENGDLTISSKCSIKSFEESTNSEGELEHGACQAQELEFGQEIALSNGLDAASKEETDVSKDIGAASKEETYVSKGVGAASKEETDVSKDVGAASKEETDVSKDVSRLVSSTSDSEANIQGSQELPDSDGDVERFLPSRQIEVSDVDMPHSFQMEVMDMFNKDERSYVFNPLAQPQEVFQDCITPKNESGHCRYVQHCLVPSLLNSLDSFMEYVCIIEERYIGICCPEFPVSTIKVKWENPENFSTSNDSTNTTIECGIGTNTRIVGGSKADPKAWPWMVALLSKPKRKFFCGGALINNRYVLTAAHCTFGVPRNEIIVRVGEYDFKDDNDTHEEFMVIKIKRHGRYSQMTLSHDIALLKVDRPVAFSKLIKTICLPEAKKEYVGEIATLVGWGNLEGGGATSDVLQIATFPVLNNTDCARIHGLPISPSLICTKSEEKDKGACNHTKNTGGNVGYFRKGALRHKGDSGGPLMLLDDENRWKTIGVVSWGRRGCDPKFPTVYTRVSHYLDWIKEHSK